MQIDNLPFALTLWQQIEPPTHQDERGVAAWRTRRFGNIPVRLVEYSAGLLVRTQRAGFPRRQVERHSKVGRPG